MKNIKKINILRIIIGTSAVAFIIIGASQSGYHDTLMKAITVCLECIGIG
ncbi:MAG: CD1871A family CXXC motif-containing protein [Ruminiclostridium sp.]|nr:CD1871A family CXXC motif-containing protein [Ruminiclostridium sp.]